MDPALLVDNDPTNAKYNAKLLFKYFCNNLYLGQWQLAQSCIQRLLLYTNEHGPSVTDILDDVINHPFNRSIASDSLPSPCHLAWLCLLEQDKINQKQIQTSGISTSVERSSIEFHFLLLEACSNVTDSVLKELYLYYRWVHSDAARSHAQTLHLSSNLLRFLQTTLSRQPDLGHALISALTISYTDVPTSKNNRTLQLVYISSINSLIDTLTQVDIDDQDKHCAVENVYRILACFSPSENSGIPLRQLFCKLLEHCKNGHKFVNKTAIQSVLMGKVDNHILDEFCRIDYECEINNAVATYQTCANLTENQRCLLHLSTLSDVSDRWKMFYLLSSKNQIHLLGTIMETGLSLIRSSLFEELEQFMAPPELWPLKPLLLLLGWTCCNSSTEAKQLLKTLWSDNRPSDHPAITAGCNKLAYQIDLIQWCLEKTRPLVSAETSMEPKYQRAAEIFKDLEDHSVLYVLHQSTKLSSLDQQEVVQLLQKVPLQGQTGESSDKRRKTVRFQGDKETDTQTEFTTPKSLEQQKDISIYTGYCVLKTIMDAILFCAENTDERLVNPIRKRSRHKVATCSGSGSSSESEVALKSLPSGADICDKNVCDENENSLGDSQKDVQATYKENVTEKLVLVKSYLSKLQPLTFRVEILENVFSLLFLTHEDIVDTVIASDYDSDEMDDRRRSTSIETPALSPLVESSSVTGDVGITFDVPQVTTEPHSSVAYDIPFDDVSKTKSRNPDVSQTKPRKAEKSVDMKEVEQKLENVKSKLAENLDQTDRDLFHERRLSSMSENISSYSTCSTASLAPFGFIVNEYLVRDILGLLKECLVDLSAAKYQLFGSRSDMKEKFKPTRDMRVSKSYDIDPASEEPLTHLVKSSVTIETIQKRITQLQKITSEAQWRFQLVSHDQIPKTVGTVLPKLVVATADMSDDEVDVAGLASQKGHRKRKISPRLESENSGPSYNSFQGRRRSRSLLVAMRPGQVRSQSLISQMLASPVSLLTMSIRKGNFTQTKQIIKLCKLEKTPEAVEVYFSQAYQKASRSVAGLTRNVSTQSSTIPGKPSMMSLANVAAAGVATVSVASISDELLNFPTLPRLPELDKDVPVPHHIAPNFDPENLPVIVLLDLACTAARNWEVCNHLIDAIKTRLPPPMKQATEVPKSLDPKIQTKTKQKSSKIKSFSDILSHIENLLHLGVEEQFSRHEQRTLTKSFQQSIQYYFCHGVHPLTSQNCRESAVLCQTLAYHVDKVQEAFHLQKKRKRTNSETPAKMEMRHRLGSTDSISSGSGSARDKPVLHHCMKQLIHVMESGLPRGGLVSFMTRKQELPPVKNKNYLLSLYEHCKELAYLVWESESKTQDTSVVPKNYFIMLEEGPIRILGRMMFNKKMPPARLEKVAEKLSLNLTHIIVYSCCVRVPSKRLPPLPPVTGNLAYEVHDGKVVYNCPPPQQSDVPRVELVECEKFLRGLLTQLINLMKDLGSRCNAEGLFDMTSAELMVDTADYHNIIGQLHVLQAADLAKLDKPQRRCFYGNLQTVMTIHCFMNHILARKAQESSTERDVGHTLPWKPYSEMSVTEQISWLNVFSYRVGQLGVISLFEVKYIINRCGLPPSSEWGLMLEHRLMALDDTDPWVGLAPTPDPHLMFTMTTCCRSSAPVQVLEPSSVKDDLGTSMRQFLQNTVEVDTAKKVVRIPEVLLWHRRDFISDLHFMENTGENEGLLHFIATQLSEEKERALHDLLSPPEDTEETGSTDPHAKIEHPFDIEVVPYSKDFLCVFEFKSLHQSAIPPASPSPSAKSHSGDSTLSYDMPYNLTTNTLEYIKSDCPLVATLVSLVCSDEFDDMESEMQENYFNVSLSPPTDVFNDRSWSPGSFGRIRSPSAMALVDIKSYRYEKLTNEYPTLKRHLLNFIAPLAAIEDNDIMKGEDQILKLLTSDIIDKFKSNMLSLHESSSFKLLLTDLLNDWFSLRKWDKVLQVIDCVPVTTLRQDTSLQNLHDFALCCLVHTTCSKSEKRLPKEKSEEVYTLMHQVMCPETRSRLLLAIHRKLEIEHNVGLFHMCLCDSGLGKAMTAAVQNKYNELKVYHRITDCAKNLQIKLAMQNSELISEEDKLAAKKKHRILDQFTDWCTVVEWTRTTPREVLALLIKAGDFETARSWCRQQNLDRAIQLEIDENHLISLLSDKPPNTTRAFMILEHIKTEDTATCLAMCRKFVDVFNRQRDVAFIASYMLNELAGQLGNDDKDRLRLTHIGARIMLCLPERLHCEYSHLVTTPRYLLEQLIMNMKPDLAGKAYLTVKDEYDLILSPQLQFTAGQFNTLVAMYAKKALEFTVVQVLELAEKEQMFARNSGSSQDGDNTRVSPHHKAEQSKSSPQPRANLEPTPVKRRTNDPYGAPRASTGKTSPHPRAASGADKFVMPSEPPSRDQWVADSTTSVCMVCKVERFSMFNRRHHCRRCGRVVCAACSAKTTQIRGVSTRTCEDCYREIVKTSTTDRWKSADDLYQQQRLSGGSLPPQQFTPDHHPAIPEEHPLSLTEVISHNRTAWKLQVDDQYNSQLREDFYFDQAPSTSLCISILDLHSNPRECGRLILKLCDDLSSLLKPIAPGVPNPEVDYSLIMSMTKYLLFHAKMKFMRCGDNKGLGQCDVYQGLVDLLGLLVVANYRDLPSIEELTKMDSVQRLRDKLIQDERLPLAMEVSTKCGIDPTGVWVAMGMTCLPSGDFSGAREKFSKCLRAPKDRNVCSPMNKLLSDIIQCLETMPGTGAMEIQQLMANPGSVKSLIMTPSTFAEEASLDCQQFQECVHYLKTYASFLSVVHFYRQHGYYMKAVQYILDHKCSTEVYIEGLLKPSLEAGELGRLTDQLIMIDPSLDKWTSYLTAGCRYLVKNRLHHVLYSHQLFMKDYIRAGMTCFNYFYQEGAHSYLDLANRVQHLFTAQQHMQAYLDPAQWGNIPHPLTQPQGPRSWTRQDSKGDTGSVRLVKGPEEVKRYIKTIALQIEVTKFLQACLTSGTGEAASIAAGLVDSSKLPTLFASPQVRTDLAIIVLLSGEDVQSCFSLATRVIKEYKLGAISIYTHAAREMAKHRRYDNMRELLQCVEKSGMGSDDVWDEIVGACLLVVADTPSEAKEADNIIKLLRKDPNKINACILCGKLRSAYLIAVKENREDDVKRILSVAKRMKQAGVINICNKWLEQYQHSRKPGGKS